MHLTATPQPLRELIPGVPDHVEAAIMRGLARERENRFASMAAFIGTLTSAVAAPAPARSLPTEILSATGQEPALHVQRTAALPARTTFSRATGEVGVEASDEALLAAARSQRRMPFVVGGVALVGLAIFLLLRPGHVSAPRATASTTSDTTVAAPVSGSGAPAAVVVPEKLEPIAPVAPSIKADAKVSPPALEGKPSATKEARATARRTGSLPTTKKGRSEERWLAH
jgi:serine/threonine-protein kinase